MDIIEIELVAERIKTKLITKEKFKGKKVVIIFIIRFIFRFFIHSTRTFTFTIFQNIIIFTVIVITFIAFTSSFFYRVFFKLYSLKFQIKSIVSSNYIAVLFIFNIVFDLGYNKAVIADDGLYKEIVDSIAILKEKKPLQNYII